MALLLLRTFLIYFLIIVAMRLMGKKQLGELQPSELVSTILISNLASISIESLELPLLSSIVPVFVIVSLEILLSALCMACLLYTSCSEISAAGISSSARLTL